MAAIKLMQAQLFQVVLLHSTLSIKDVFRVVRFASTSSSESRLVLVARDLRSVDGPALLAHGVSVVSHDAWYSLLPLLTPVAIDLQTEPLLGAYRLSPREQQVLSGAVAGEDDHVIAENLGCSYGTVRTYWQRILDKTGLDSRRTVLALVARSALRRAER